MRKGLNGEVPRSGWHELAAHAGEQATAHRQRRLPPTPRPLAAITRSSNGDVPALGLQNQEVFRWTRLPMNRATAAGMKRHRQNHGPHQRRHHGERHRMEHLPFHPSVRRWQVYHHHDDELPEQQRAARSSDARNTREKRSARVIWPAKVCLRMGQTAHVVLDDHHRPVDDDAGNQRPRPSGWRSPCNAPCP